MNLYVAVVVRKGISISMRGSWTSFVSEDKDKAIQWALSARREWKVNGKPYDVLVGELTEEATEPQVYKLRSLDDSGGGTEETR